jgi:hypothetical protein
MSKHHHHHHHHCPDEVEEIADRIRRRCCGNRRPDALLPEELSPADIRKLRCILDCLSECLCRPIGNFSRLEAEENILRRR